MPKYKSIQFIGYGIRTDLANEVKKKISIPGKPSVEFLAGGTYLGLASESDDITARCTLLRSAIHVAGGLAEAASDTLKVFMTPEFFFRGAKGAYSFDGRDKVVSELQEMVKSAKWQDWLFVFGSIISWSAPALKRSTGLFSSKYDVIDPDKAKEVYNTVLVQEGGWEGHEASEKAWIVTKNLKSDVDFKWFDDFLSGREWAGPPRDLTLQEYREMASHATEHTKSWKLALSDWDVWRDLKGNAPQAALDQQFDAFKNKTRAQFNIFAETRAQPLIQAREAAWKKARAYHSYAGTGIFRFHDIDFGLEICLDHSSKRLKKGAAADPTCVVDVHLIPSAGMSIQDDSVVAKQGGYVFNCDGTRNVVKLAGGMSTADYRRLERRNSPCVALKWSSAAPKKLNARMKPAPVPVPGGVNIHALFTQWTGSVHVLEPVAL